MSLKYERKLEESVARLEEARHLLSSEIQSYPTPISGCDAQFNHLLSDRARISRAIRALQESPFVATPRKLEPEAVPESR